MKELAELRKIMDTQKTVSTKRLKPLFDEIQRSYIQTANKVKSQKETIIESIQITVWQIQRRLGYRSTSRLMRNLKELIPSY
ncbi:hypothetical protein ACQKML_13410 [Peribacillus frigoritolerans]